jgi:hypothetical protein
VAYRVVLTVVSAQDEMRRHAQELGLTCEVESESTGGGGQLGRILIFRKMRS